jgi:hypothetical protein
VNFPLYNHHLEEEELLFMLLTEKAQYISAFKTKKVNKEK